MKLENLILWEKLMLTVFFFFFKNLLFTNKISVIGKKPKSFCPKLQKSFSLLLNIKYTKLFSRVDELKTYLKQIKFTAKQKNHLTIISANSEKFVQKYACKKFALT